MKTITRDYLLNHPDHIFVFGDNTLRSGLGGAAILRHEPNALGFITKKYPSHFDSSYYRPDEYKEIFENEMSKLIQKITQFPHKTFLISKIGAGLANRFQIWEKVIQPGIERLQNFENVVFLWKES